MQDSFRVDIEKRIYTYQDPYYSEEWKKKAPVSTIRVNCSTASLQYSSSLLFLADGIGRPIYRPWIL